MHPVAQSASTTIKISIEQLTALFCGMRQASSLQWSGELEIEGDERLLRHLDNAWQATPPFCWDFF
jgi:predicted acetyltransferase